MDSRHSFMLLILVMPIFQFQLNNIKLFICEWFIVLKSDLCHVQGGS